ncbi:MAG TPA: phage terminase large subunit family protein [Thermoanaerobaculia bacterium]|jgi:hypothetical protein|nr:phage terminase large subunit family protein [Thermoanaerobaculia bacterium]
MNDVARDLIDDILDRPVAKRRNAEAKRPRRSLERFLQEEIHTDSGLFSFTGHEPLLFIVRLIERLIVERVCDARVAIVKAEQIGFSTLAIGVALWAVAELGYNVGYFFPDDKMASEFGAARFNPTIERSLFLAGRMKDAGVDRGVLKELGDGKYLYLKGLGTLKGAIANPQDLQLLDEFDKIPANVARWTKGRMTHSKLRLAIRFSAPYADGAGIHKSFDDGSQRRLLIKCLACGRGDICLEESFPECMRQFNGTWVRVCPDCHKKLDIAGNSEWVATHPQREKDGEFSFRVSALSMGAIDANLIMHDYLKAVETGDPDEMAIFDRSKRAFPNAGAMQPITDVELRKMERDYVLKLQAASHPVFFGVDAGNACWFWAEEYLPDGTRRLVWAEKMSSDSWVERTTALIDKLRPRFGVIDKKPLLTDSRKLAYAFPRNIALLDFANGHELTMVEEQLVEEDTIGGAQNPRGPKYLCVKVDRDVALAKFCAESTHPDHGLLLPNERTRTMTLVGEHLKKLQKVVTKSKSGNEIHRFIDGVDNHFGMAGMSAVMARLVAPSIQPFAFFPCDDSAVAGEDYDDYRDLGGFV